MVIQTTDSKACNALNCINGACDETDHCVCNEGFEGVDCSIPIVPPQPPTETTEVSLIEAKLKCSFTF